MTDRNYGAIREAEKAIKLIDFTAQSGVPFAFDIEAGYTGEDKVGVSLQQFHPDYIVVGISFTASPGWARYIPLAHDDGGNVDDVVGVLRALWRLLRTGNGVAHNCFAGDTEVITRTGIRKLGDLAGGTADLWTERGWVTAPIIAYPEEETYEVVFAPYGRSRSTVRRTVRATANHRWLLSKASRKAGSGPETWLPGYTTTDQLRPGAVIPDLSVDVTPDLYSDGFRHGLIFADGTRASRSRERGTLHYSIQLCGAKEQYKDRFEKYTYRTSAKGDPVVNWYRSPHGYDLKQVPPEGVDSQYVADFIAGWLAGDGSHNQQGSRIITTTDASAVDWLERHGASGGFPISGVSASVGSSGYTGKSVTDFKVTVGGGPMAWTVKEVRRTGIIEPVFCPSVPEVGRFALGFGGYTANCAYELKGMSRLFRERLWDDPEVGSEVRASAGMFPILADTMLLVWLAACYHPLRVGKDLKSVAKEAFGIEMTKFQDLFPFVESDLGPATKRGRSKQVRFNSRNAYSPKIIEYACEDSVASLLIFRKHYEELKDTLIFKTEMALLPGLVEMEAGPIDETGRATGNMLFDWPLIRKKCEEIREFGLLMGEEILTELSERLGRTININLGSPPQLAKILYSERPEGLGLPVKVRSEKTEAPSTSDDALKVIAKSDPIIKKILEYRQVMKLHGSYLAKFVAELDYSGTGVVFPNHNQAGALTGRMSVDQVSYQQWPKPYHFELKSGRTFDLNFRDLFISPDCFRQVGFDYANVEMRIAGAISGERKIIDAFNNGQDLHKATAAATFNVPFEEVTKKQRQSAKAQPLYEKILTPSGWQPMGSMRVGAEVIGSNGRPTTVTGVFPQEGKRPIYRVVLSDGATVDMDAGHYLTVRNRNTKNATWVLKTLQEIMDVGWRQPVKGMKYSQPKYELPARPVVEYAEYPALPIDPYFLGLLLGDGGFRGDWCPYYATSDEELARYVRDHCPAGVKIHEDPRNDIMGFHFPSAVKHGANPLTQALRDLGLWGKIDSDKFIPEVYLRACPQDRLAVLQGIMDTDGSPQYSGANLRVTSESLVRGVQEIARSLGGTATFGTVPSRNKPVFRTQVILPSECPFRLTRKIDKLLCRKYELPVRIFDIRHIGEDFAQCISVDSPDGLYISNGFSVIHNTLNFAILFGSGPANIAEMLTSPTDPVTKEDAQEMLDAYLAGYPDLANWIGRQKAHGREEKVILTHFGRRFTVWDYYDPREWIRAKGDRMTVNAPVQGTAADILKIAMVRTIGAIKKAGLQNKIRPTLTVHDALEFLVHDSVTTQQVIDLIDPQVNFQVPGFPLEIRADWHEGFQWGATAEIKLDENKRIVGYEMEVEQPWLKKAWTFEGSTLHEVLTQYYDWEWQTYGTQAPLYAKRNPDYVIPERVIVSSESAATDEEEDPGWFHSQEWHDAQAHPKLATITIQEMPTFDQLKSLSLFLDTIPGFVKVALETPDGTLMFDTTHGVKEDHQPAISMILGGARLTIMDETVDSEAVLVGMDL